MPIWNNTTHAYYPRARMVGSSHNNGKVEKDSMLDEMVSNILKPILALNSILLRKQSNIHIAKFNGHKTPRFSTK